MGCTAEFNVDTPAQVSDTQPAPPKGIRFAPLERRRSPFSLQDDQEEQKWGGPLGIGGSVKDGWIVNDTAERLSDCPISRVKQPFYNGTRHRYLWVAVD